MEQTITLPGGKKIPRKPALVLGGSAAVFILWRYWSAAKAPQAAEEDTTSSDVMDLTGATADGGSGVAGGSTVGDPMPWSSIGAGYTPTTSQAPATNQDWYTRALEFATSVDYDPQTAAAALGRYLAGTSSAGDIPLITSILGYAGTPPVGDFGYPVIPPVTSTPPAAGSPVTTLPAPAAPVATTTPAVKVKPPAAKNTAPNWGWFKSISPKNTLAGIASKYTQSPGESITHAVQDLIALNPSLKGKTATTKVAPNTVVKVRADAGAYVPTS